MKNKKQSNHQSEVVQQQTGSDCRERLVRLSVMHAVYVRDEGQDWQLFSAEPNLECAKTTTSVLEVTRPNSDCCIFPPDINK
jgi:hypothetical protein